MRTSTYVYADTRDMDRTAWLEARRHGIGGSDAGAIVGMNEYASPYTVWADKLGMSTDKEDSEAMRVGRDLEDYVAKRFSERSGLKVRRVNSILGNYQYMYSLANIDREIVGADLPAGLECKTASALSMGQYKGGSFPDRYYCQCVHYMAVSEKRRWYIAILVMGKAFYIYQMTRIQDDTVPDWCDGSVYVDQGEIDALMGAEKEFWEEYVVPRKTPPLDGNENTTSMLMDVTGASNPGDDEKQLHSVDAFRNYADLGAQIKILKQQQEMCKQAIILELGDARKGYCGAFTVTNSATSRSSFDMDSFRQDHPHMDLTKYYKSTQSTRLTIREGKAK